MNVLWKSYKNSALGEHGDSLSLCPMGLIIGSEMILIKLEEEDTIYIQIP